MTFFCLLWIPLFFFFRRTSRRGECRVLWALILGSAAAFLSFLSGGLVVPGGFGFTRWISGFVDIVCLPVLIPLCICFLLIFLKIFPADTDHAGFTLLFLVPFSVYRAINWISPGLPNLLILVPVLWAAQAEGIPFCVNCITRRKRWFGIILLSIVIAALPLAAVTSWWAFYRQEKLTGFLLLFVALIPAVISILLDCAKKILHIFERTMSVPRR